MTFVTKEHFEMLPAFEVGSTNGRTDVVMDETLCDAKSVQPSLEVTQKQGDETTKLDNSRINMLVGKNIMNKSNSDEVQHMRETFSKYCYHISSQRGCASWERRAIYTYPPEYSEIKDLSQTVVEKLHKYDLKLDLLVHFIDSWYTITVAHNDFAEDVIAKVIELRQRALKNVSTTDVSSYVLKVHGRLNFFLGEISISDGKEAHKEKPIACYKYISDCVVRDKPIKLRVVPKCKVDIEPYSLTTPHIQNGCIPHYTEKPPTSVWQINPRFYFQIDIVHVVNVPESSMEFQVVCGLFHGSEALCECRKTSVKSGTNLKWEETLTFGIPVFQLPRMAKLATCIVGYEKDKQVVIAWLNIALFDYKGHLKAGQSRHNCWSNNGEINNLNPIGTVAPCEQEMGILMDIGFTDFGKRYMYPTEEEIRSIPVDISHHRSSSKQHKALIEEIMKKDPLAPLLEEEKELLWQFRTTCMNEYPHSLPKLLQCAKWGNMGDIAQVYYLLQNWDVAGVDVEIALDLLDYKYPDYQVRKLAVHVLDSLSDMQLEMYLVQLIQGLKYEMYLDSPLARYLLRRALNNRRIGHFLFWHLKAEISNHDYSVQYGLLLEMYCRGSISHVDILQRQVEAINKFKTITNILQSCSDASRPGYFKDILHALFDGEGGKLFNNLISPLDPSVQVQKLKIDKCKFMTSAKKPLWLVFENADAEADDVVVIFKDGDDLRQDMLTLLSLRLMDTVWKQAGYDYGIIPYQCLSTGPMTGLIEVVPESETLSRIQAGIGTIKGVLKEDSLYCWLQEYCWGDEEKFATCIKNFARSVVGYSVATYVLGVGDRHNDNIMMKYDTGQLFHIDFGHFLGNFKYKFGFRREFVKFILPDEFIYMIKRMDKHKSQAENFNNFKHMCVEAFKVLRSRGNLFITVFAMLLSTGIPELEHPDDIDYIRNSLALLRDEKEAELQFHAAFQEAYDKRRTTSMNFILHNLRQYWIN